MGSISNGQYCVSTRISRGDNVTRSNSRTVFWNQIRFLIQLGKINNNVISKMIENNRFNLRNCFIQKTQPTVPGIQNAFENLKPIIFHPLTIFVIRTTHTREPDGHQARKERVRACTAWHNCFCQLRCLVVTTPKPPRSVSFPQGPECKMVIRLRLWVGASRTQRLFFETRKKNEKMARGLLIFCVFLKMIVVHLWLQLVHHAS